MLRAVVLQEPTDALHSGQRLLWYRVEKVLGQGVLGFTYLCWDPQRKRRVVIKEYLPSALAGREGSCGAVHLFSESYRGPFVRGLERFISEAEHLDRCKHPSIAKIVDVFETNDTAYLVMEYEEGESLEAVLAGRETLGEDEIIGMLVPLLDGLEAVHRQHYIHSDIQPRNILIREDGNPVLVDFGFARQALEDPSQRFRHEGSDEYLPIERYWCALRRQGPWTDIYGLGATLYQAVTGTPPIGIPARAAAIFHEARDPYLAAIERGSGCYSPRLLLAIDHALEFGVDYRPQSVRQWRKELQLYCWQVPRSEVISPPMGAAQSPTRPDTKPTPPACLGPADFLQMMRACSHKPASTERDGVLGRRRRLVPRSGIAAAALGAVAAGVLLAVGVPDAEAPRPAAAVAADHRTQGLAALAVGERANPDDERSVQIEKLLIQARADIRALRLAVPRGRAALEKYRQVLALDPHNPEAARGLGVVADKYVQLAHRAMDSNRLALAKQYLHNAAAISWNSDAVRRAWQALDKKRDAQARPTL